MAGIQLIVGDKAAEFRAIQLLSVAVSEALPLLERLGIQGSPRWVVGPLLMAASHNLALPARSGPDPPLEVLAVSARNTFEIWLRLLHVLASEENRQAWRDENLTDQLEVYDAILALETPDSPKEAKAAVLAEVDRVTQLAASRGINRRKKLMSGHALAKATGHEAEYDAFWKLYSKLVHPSSWTVNSPSSVSAPMYRMTLTANAQVYGREILKAVEKEFGVSSDACYASAVARVAADGATGATATRLVQ